MNNAPIKRTLLIVGIPTLYAIMLRVFFGIESWTDLYTVMSVSFLCCLPTIVGALTIYFSSREHVQNLWYRMLVPWIPIFLFFIVTLLFAIEGWACWIMVLPLFLVAASIGGLIGGYYKRRKKDNNVYISFVVLLPLLASPLESLIKTQGKTYKAYTCIDIKASPKTIWDNVTRVREIKQEQDKGWLTRSLGFPRPVKAELNYNGVGAYRKAVFTNGLVFHETVSAYEDQKKMFFSIKAYPHEIPSTTMDEHVVIGGKFFDVLNGTYELEKLNDSVNRLHLYSHFTLATNFNFYASWWAKMIMKDIQNNILQVEKLRSEQTR